MHPTNQLRLAGMQAATDPPHHALAGRDARTAEHFAAMPNAVTACGIVLCLYGRLDGRLDQCLRLDAQSAASLSQGCARTLQRFRYNFVVQAFEVLPVQVYTVQEHTVQ